MAEQDREDAVPSVLNDLMDVDGDPAEGDGMAFSDGAWRPGVAAGLLPANGPVLNIWSGTYAGANIADLAATKVVFDALVMSRAGWEYLGAHPDLGEWLPGSPAGYKRWRATEPGVYTCYVLQSIAASAYHANGYANLTTVLSAIGGVTWAGDLTRIVGPVGIVNYNRADHLTLFISQGMIDAGFGGFDCFTPYYEAGGAERANYLNLVAVIERHSPGSTFDYYGNL